MTNEKDGGKRTRSDADGHKRAILSPREIEVLNLIVQGYSAKEAAEVLSLSPRTVERHIDNARSKLGARNRPHLVIEAIETGLIRMPQE
jgi:DNA-binding CsgD family transcriptional regulator